MSDENEDMGDPEAVDVSSMPGYPYGYRAAMARVLAVLDSREALADAARAIHRAHTDDDWDEAGSGVRDEYITEARFAIAALRERLVGK